VIHTVSLSIGKKQAPRQTRERGAHETQDDSAAVVRDARRNHRGAAGGTARHEPDYDLQAGEGGPNSLLSRRVGGSVRSWRCRRVVGTTMIAVLLNIRPLLPALGRRFQPVRMARIRNLVLRGDAFLARDYAGMFVTDFDKTRVVPGWSASFAFSAGVCRIAVASCLTFSRPRSFKCGV
jgi:hypothetical protein